MKTFKQILQEGSGKDSQYVQRGLEDLIDDFKRVPQEKHMVPILRWVMDRLNQSFPDGDVTDADIIDLISEPGARSALKKSKMSKAEVADMVLEF
jgi:hypothetical protein